jgi:hypothetical protein
MGNESAVFPSVITGCNDRARLVVSDAPPRAVYIVNGDFDEEIICNKNLWGISAFLT